MVPPELDRLKAELQTIKKKAAEPGREALAASACFAALASSDFRYRRHVRLGSDSSIDAGFFKSLRFEDSLVCFGFRFAVLVLRLWSSAQTQPADNFVITLNVDSLEIVEQTSPLRDHL